MKTPPRTAKKPFASSPFKTTPGLATNFGSSKLTKEPDYYPADLAYPEMNANGLLFLDSFTHARYTSPDGSKRFVAGFDITFMNVDYRDIESDRYSMEIIDNGRSLLCKCPLLPWDYLYNYEAIMNGKKDVGLHSSADVEEEFNTKRLRLVADKSRHNHEFILDFKGRTITLNEKPVTIVMQSFFENKLSKETELSPEPVAYAATTTEMKFNLVYKVAIEETEPRLITEYTPLKKQSGQDVMDRLRSKLKRTNIH